MEPKVLQVLENGRMSRITLDHLGEKIKCVKERKLSELKVKYRLGVLDTTVLTNLLSAYCALEDLEAELKKDIAGGTKAALEMQRNASGSDTD